MTISKMKIWLLAIRPKTLPAALAPVLMATAMAYGDGVHHFPTAAITLLGALCIQIATNLVNDYCDFKKGADNSQRVGPTRVIQAGLIPPGQMITAIVFILAVASGLCFLLYQRGGWPIAWIGILSILSGIFYTAGPFPLAYLGLGELFVLTFFGPVAVAGTYYVQSLEINPAIILAGFGPGFLSAAILAINNLRDIDTDIQAGKRTLAVRFGTSFAQKEYIFFYVCACLTPVLLYCYMLDRLKIVFTVTLLFFLLPAIDVIYRPKDGPALNNALAYTGRILLIYSVLFGIGWIL